MQIILICLGLLLLAGCRKDEPPTVNSDSSQKTEVARVFVEENIDADAPIIEEEPGVVVEPEVEAGVEVGPEWGGYEDVHEHKDVYKHDGHHDHHDHHGKK